MREEEREQLSADKNVFLTGAAAAPAQGCREKTDVFNPHPKDWSAFRSTDYGYTRMQVVNASHLYLEQVSDDQVGQTHTSVSDMERTNALNWGGGWGG